MSNQPPKGNLRKKYKVGPRLPWQPELATENGYLPPVKKSQNFKSSNHFWMLFYLLDIFIYKMSGQHFLRNKMAPAFSIFKNDFRFFDIFRHISTQSGKNWPILKNICFAHFIVFVITNILQKKSSQSD